VSADPVPRAERDESAALLAAVLADSHPLMVEAFCVAALAHQFDLPLFSAIRNRDDRRDAGLVERLRPYSFVIPDPRSGSGAGLCDPGQGAGSAEPALDRAGRRGYCAGPWPALAHWEAHPDPNPFAQAQHQVYHGSGRRAVRWGGGAADRPVPHLSQRAPVCGHRAAAGCWARGQGYLDLLGRKGRSSQLEDLLGYLELRLAQLREDWERPGTFYRCCGPGRASICG